MLERRKNMKMNRRELLWIGFAAAACSAGNPRAFASGTKPVIRLSMASYSFHKFDMAHVIDFMHQLKCPYLNVKDVHLPMTPLADVPHLVQFNIATRAAKVRIPQGCRLEILRRCAHSLRASASGALREGVRHSHGIAQSRSPGCRVAFSV